MIGILLAVAVVGIVLAMAPVVDAGPAELRVAGTEVVGPGETLWDIASDYAGEGVSTQRLVAEIQRVNGLGTGPVPAYTPIVIPVLP